MEPAVLALFGIVVGVSLGFLVFVPLWTREEEERLRAVPVPASEGHRDRR